MTFEGYAPKASNEGMNLDFPASLDYFEGMYELLTCTLVDMTLQFHSNDTGTSIFRRWQP